MSTPTIHDTVSEQIGPSKAIGVLGGMSPESTTDYYQRLNAGVREALGGRHSARLLVHSVDFAEASRWIASGDDRALGACLTSAARGLERAGADFLIMACNTAHQVAPQIAAASSIPFIHIADVLGEALRRAGYRRIGLLGTRVTMEAPFYRDHLLGRFAVETLVPEAGERERVHRIIMEELCFQDFRDESRQVFEQISASLGARGADVIVLACTELGLLLPEPEIAGLPVFDTTRLHVERAVDLALGRDELPAASRAA